MKIALPRIITRNELRQIVPYSPQWILTLEKREQFPKRIPIGPRRVGWRLSEIEQWLAERELQFGGDASIAERSVVDKGCAREPNRHNCRLAAPAGKKTVP